MIERRSAEEWRAEFDEILRRCNRGSERGERGGLTRPEAVSRLRRLGFTTGEALRLLRPKGGK